MQNTTARSKFNICVCVCLFLKKRTGDFEFNPPYTKNNWCLSAQLIKFLIIE